jgi:hypothetical protein
MTRIFGYEEQDKTGQVVRVYCVGGLVTYFFIIIISLFVQSVHVVDYKYIL